MDEKTIEALQAYTCPSCHNIDEDGRRSLPALAAANDAKTDRDAEVEAALGEKEKAREAERQAALAKRSSPKSKRVAESKEGAGDTVEGAISPYVTRDISHILYLLSVILRYRPRDTVDWLTMCCTHVSA